MFGYDTGVIAGANLYIDQSFQNVTNLDKELIVSMTLAGAAIGSLFGGPVSDTFGRKGTILLADALFTIGSLIMAFSPFIAILVFGRFVVGLGVGTAAMVVPVYLAEISPTTIRGILVGSNIVCIVIGQVVAISTCLALGNRWRWMLGLAAVPSVLQAVGILFLIESPRWLFKVHRHLDGIKAITTLYDGDEYSLKPIIQEQKREADNVRQYEFIGLANLIRQLFTKYRP